MLSDKIIRLKANPEIIQSEFLAIALSSSAGQEQLLKKKSGMALSQTNISQKILRETVLALPGLDEQRGIVSVISEVDRSIQSNEQKLTQLQTLKSGLMSDLLSGRVRVALKHQ